MSLNRRTTHRRSVTTTWEIEALSAPMKAQALRPGRLRQDLTDDTPVDDQQRRGSSGWAAAIRSMRRPDPGGELVGRLAARDEVPPLLLDQPEGERVPVDELLLEDPALPLAQVDLAEVVLDHRHVAGGRGQRRGRLGRAAQGDVT